METVMDWAVTHGYRLDNPAGRSLLKVLPPVKRLKKHHAALPYEQVPGALAQVQESKAHALTKLALEFLVLTAHPHRLGDGPKRPEGKHNIELVFGKPAGNRSRQTWRNRRQWDVAALGPSTANPVAQSEGVAWRHRQEAALRCFA